MSDRRAAMRRSRGISWAIGTLVLLGGVGAFFLVDPRPENGRSQYTPAPRPDPIDDRTTSELPSSGPAPTIRPIPAPDEPTADVAATRRATSNKPGSVAGTVVDHDGRALRGSAMVYAFPVDSIGPASRPRAQMTTLGDFYLTLWPHSPSEWIIVAHADNRRPAMVRLPDPAGKAKEGVRLVLELGLTIEGVVRVNGTLASTGQVNADLESDAVAPGEVDELRWNAGSFETKHASAFIDDEGKFSFHGLARGTYRLTAFNPVGHAMMGVCTRSVAAPASGIEMNFASGVLTITVSGNGQPIPNARIQLSEPDGGWITNFPSRPFVVPVRAGVHYSVEVANPGFREAKVDVPPLATGEARQVDVALEASDEPELRLTLDGASTLLLPSVGVRLVPLATIDEKPSGVLLDLRRRLKAIGVQGDEYVVPRVPYPAGRYIVVVVPSNREEWILPAEVEIDLPAHGTARAKLPAVEGGRMTFMALSPNGSPLEHRLVVRDHTGVEVLSRDGYGDLSRKRDRAHDAARTEAAALRIDSGVLPPGRYEVEVTVLGFEPVRRKVDLIAGRTVTEEVRLQRK
jgi:hypothetical protein